MFQIERQDHILEYINKAQKANTNELADYFQVSKVTIRRDIDTLASQGLVVKTHGGAISVTKSLHREIPYAYKAEILVSGIPVPPHWKLQKTLFKKISP